MLGVLAFLVLIAMFLLVRMSCSSDIPEGHKVYPVKGKILVNGQPAADCMISLTRTFEDNSPSRVTPFGRTNAEGVFEITSYVANDGAPEGEYVVTIEWRDATGVLKNNFDGPDRLGGEYAQVDRNKARQGFVVKIGPESQELPPFNLTQSAQAKRRYEMSKKKPPLTLGGGTN